MKIKIIFGSTASGKTAYAIGLAKQINGEVINADSMQVYKEIPILTAQPQQTEGIRHHLYGYISMIEHYNVAKYINDAQRKIKEIKSEGKVPILVGGTGLYIKSLIEGIIQIPAISEETKAQVEKIIESYSKKELIEYLEKLDPIIALKLKENDLQRIRRALEVAIETGRPLSSWQKDPPVKYFDRQDFYMIWLNPAREVVYNNINLRFEEMLKNGVIEEVKKVLDLFPNQIKDPSSLWKQFPKAHGLPELISYLQGKITLEKAIAHTQQITRNYAKRQRTWAQHQFSFDEVV